MIGKRGFIVFAFTLTALFTPEASLMAADDTKTRSTLRGLEAVFVQVAPFDFDLEKELNKGGLTRAFVRKTVEREVENGGIKVLYEEDLHKSTQHGILHVIIDILPPEAWKKFKYTVDGEKFSKDISEEKYLYAVRLELGQIVILLRDPAIQQRATTWSRSSLGFRRISRIESDVRDQVVGFVEAYSAANKN